MYSIISSNYSTQLLKQFRKWAENEWGTVNSIEGNVEGSTVPPAILAINNQDLLGGVGFTSFAKPGSEETGLWINALLVAPAHRHIGIGSKLVQAAEVEASYLKTEELFVYTDIPDFYQKLDWLIVDDTNESVVLKKLL